MGEFEAEGAYGGDEGVAEAVPEPLLEGIFRNGVHGAGQAFAEGEKEEEVPETLSEIIEGVEVQPEVEDID